MGMIIEGYGKQTPGLASPLGVGNRMFEGIGGESDGKKGKSVFAGDLNLQDSIAERRERGQKWAMKRISDALAKDVALDDQEQQMRDRVKELTTEIRDYGEDVRRYDEQIEALKDEFGEDGLEDREEYKDLVAHRRQAAKDLGDRQTELRANVSGITSMRIERLKTHGMTDAQEEKDEMMDALGEELMGMLVGGAMDKIDSDLEEQVKEAKEQKEEKEEDEEKLEKLEERREEIEAFADRVQAKAERAEAESRRIRKMTEELLDGEASTEKLETAAASLDTMGDASAMAMVEIRTKVAAAGKYSDTVSTDAAVSPEARKEIDAMMDKLKLLGEDLKGAAVDEML